MSTTTDAKGFLRPALGGAAATLAGIGLARFAYVPMFPAMVSGGWIDAGGAGLVGAANLSGYLVGALGGRFAARRLGTVRTLDVGMILAALAFAACAWNGGLTYLAFWRALAGVAGGVLMVLAGPAVQWAVAPARRGQAGGIVVAGVGSGAVLSALIVPQALSLGLSAAWLCLAALVGGLWMFAHTAWPDAPMPTGKRGPMAATGSVPFHVAYGLSGAGMVAHMVYLADLAVRARGLGAGAGSWVWLLFGAGAIGGTLAGGRMSDRWGAPLTLRVWLMIQVAAIVAALVPLAVTLGAAGLLGGFAGVGISAVALARAREIGGVRISGIWATATAAYAAAQAATAFLLAALFAQTGSHEVLFAVCLGLSFAGLAVSLWPSGKGAAPL